LTKAFAGTRITGGGATTFWQGSMAALKLLSKKRISIYEKAIAAVSDNSTTMFYSRQQK